METQTLAQTHLTRPNENDSFFQAGFFALLANISEGCFILDTSYNILYLNSVALNIANQTYEIEYGVGDNLLAAAPIERRTNLEKILSETKEGMTKSFEVSFPKPNGKVVYTDCRYSPIWNEKKRVVGISVLLKDITIEKELKLSETKRIQIEEKHTESLQLFEQFMENSPLRAWITDEDGRVHYMNKLHMEFLKLTENDIGKTLHEIFPQEISRQYALDDQTALSAGKPIEFLQTGIKPNGKKGVYKVYKFPVLIKNRKMIAGWAVELTRQVILQKRLMLQQNRIKKTIIRSIISTQEKERRQFSVELHDNVNQIISSCKLMLEVALENETKRVELVQKSYVSLKEVISEIRKICHNLNPSALEDIGLVEAISEMVDRINASGKLKIEFNHLRFQACGIDSERRITLYRILQEALNNVVKYANASQVWITLYSNDAHLLLTVRDDGRGFDLHKTKKGLGLRNILHRVTYQNGKMKMDTAPGKGCTLKVLLPLLQKQ